MGNSNQKPEKHWHSRRHETDEAQTAARERYANRASYRPLQTWDEDTERWVHHPVPVTR